MSATPLLALALALICTTASAHRPHPPHYAYTVTALPSGTMVTGINENGEVTGYMATAAGQRGYLWSRRRLGTIATPAGLTGVATAVNNGGDVAGYSTAGGSEGQSFVYADGVLTALNLLNLPAAASGHANAINDAGQVAGTWFTDRFHRAFLYSDGVTTDLGTLGGSYAAATGINRHGHVVGFSNRDDGRVVERHAFLYADGVMKDLGTINNGSVSAATAINDHGDITGHAWVEGSEHAFLYRDGVMKDLGTLGGRYSFAFDINNAGHVVGYANDPDDSGFFAFVHDGVSMRDLNSLIDPTKGWVLLDARGINDKGQIAAYGCRGEVCGGVVLTPRQRSMSMWRMPSSSYGSEHVTKPNS